MAETATMPQSVKRVMVATDRSETADRAVHWAAHLASSHQAELVLLQVLPSPGSDDGKSTLFTEAVARANEELNAYARSLAGERGQGLVVADSDLAQAILDAAQESKADVLVVGNVGMSGRKEFLLGNIPNRISHNARCTVVIVNTAMGQSTGPSGSRRRGSYTPVEGDLLARSWQIGRVLTRAGLRDLRRRGPTGDGDTMRAAARRFRAALDELGPTFAKLGQILSTRPDLLPPAFLEELATLQERVTPLTEAEVVAAMERELQVPWEDVFASIDPTPLAAGTIAQVHRATLESGERVVVKVQRPTAERDILRDLGLLELFGAKAAERTGLRRVFDIPTMIEHLSTSLRRELDFRGEAANMIRMGEVLAPFSRLAVPKVYEEYSTSRLLVMEEVQGVPVREAPLGPARTAAARQLLEGFYHQVMSAGFFHADPHPGNMKWWNDKIYLLDLGMVGEVSPRTRQLILLLMLAFSQRDAGFLTDVVLTMARDDLRGGEPPEIDVDAFREDLTGLIEHYRNLSLEDIQLGPIMQEVTQIAARRNVRIPSALMLTGKAFAQMQLAAAELDPSLDPFSVAQSWVVRDTLRTFTARIRPETLYYESQKARMRLERVLEGVEGLLGGQPGRGLEVHFQGAEQLERALEQGNRRLSLALGLSATVLSAALTAGSQRAPRWLTPALGGLSTLLATGLVLDRPRRSR